MDKNIAIIHSNLDLLGGGERVCVSLIEALNNFGIIPDVYSFSPVNKAYLGKYYGKNIKFNLKSIFPFYLQSLGKYQPIITGLKTAFLTGYDVIINTGSYTPVFMKSLIKRYIIYVYNPVSILFFPQKYKTKMLWKIYFLPSYEVIKRSISKLNNYELLAVSHFTKKRIKTLWNNESETVYPPVDMEKFGSVLDNKEREGVITIGRFSPEKNHALQLEIAKQTPDITFKICGSADTPVYKKYFERLKTKFEAMGLKNVELYPNLPFKTLMEFVGRSKIFLHTAINEDFGLTPCEAISGGCIPIVHDSGGSKEVIPFQELRYNNVSEAVKKIQLLRYGERDMLLQKLQKHVKINFSESVFQRKMLDIILNKK